MKGGRIKCTERASTLSGENTDYIFTVERKWVDNVDTIGFLEVLLCFIFSVKQKTKSSEEKKHGAGD